MIKTKEFKQERRVFDRLKKDISVEAETEGVDLPTLRS